MYSANSIMRKIHGSFIETKHMFLISYAKNHNELYCENHSKIFIVHSTVLTRKKLHTNYGELNSLKKVQKSLYKKSSHANAKMPVLQLKIKKSALQACVRTLCRCLRGGRRSKGIMQRQVKHFKLKAFQILICYCNKEISR